MTGAGFCVSGVCAEHPPEALLEPPLPTLTARALSGDRFVVDGVEHHLADVKAPPLYVLSGGAPAYFSLSRAALQAHLSDVITLREVMTPTRWGGKVVRATLTNAGQSVQEAMVTAGAVRVYPQSEDHDFIDRLLALEDAARRSGTGLWALKDYEIFNAERAFGAIGAWCLVEGVVRQAEKSGARFYLNFGDDYREDFTASVAGAPYRQWVKAGFDPASLANARVRIRGFVEAINGPSVDMTHIKQIERLD